MEPYRVTVLLDSIDTIEDVLGGAIRFAKRLDAKVEALYLKSPLSVVKQANQLSAKRDLYEDARKARKELKDQIAKMELGTSVSTKVSYGNVKDALQQYMAEQKTDVLVSTKEWFKQYGTFSSDTPWLIFNSSADFVPEKALNLGVFDLNASDGVENSMVQSLLSEASLPLRYFKIRKADETKTENSSEDSVDYVFSEVSNALDSIATYTERLKLDVLCVARPQRSGNWFETDPTLLLLRKTKVPLLFFRS
ncbi:MAG: universal stress protein [Bacteroidota bacterium]